jgi:hypothetical protein
MFPSTGLMSIQLATCGATFTQEAPPLVERNIPWLVDV